MTASSQLLMVASGCYLFGGLLVFLPRKERLFSWTIFLSGMMANALSVGMRYWQAWPMAPMHLGAAALPLCVAVAGGLALPESANSPLRTERRCLILVVCLLTVTAVVFPKDFYLPFIKSNTVFSHFFLIFGVIGKACFTVAAANAFVLLWEKRIKLRNLHPGRGESGFVRWVVLGFAFWTFSMFSGELWSYMGWGTPVVWDDPAVAAAMGAWFFYICFLHLHLTGTWNLQMKTRFAAYGGLVVLVLNLHPDLGPARWPF